MALKPLMKCSPKRSEPLRYHELSESPDDNDCGVRAIEVACDLTYDEALAFWDEKGRPRGEGSPTGWLYALERSKRVINGYLIQQVTLGRRLRLKRRQRLFNEGRWLILVPGHIFAIKDGSIYDTLDLDDLMESLVTCVWKVTPYRP